VKLPFRRIFTLLVALAALGLFLALVAYRFLLPALSDQISDSNRPIYQWFTDPASRPSLTTRLNATACPGAPFILPSDGFIGLLWNDPAAPYTVLATHTGIDIFGDGAPATVPVHAAADGWLTRLSEWLSTVIIRHDDPLQPGRTIWTYYTHMASRDGTQSFVAPAFPAGTSERPVKQGELLGYQGEYAGVGRAAIGLHIHFSIVLSDEAGFFRNETQIGNTLDPSPYLGMRVNVLDRAPRPIGCETS
jgi:peptidoglycan LD-endopeptidase LytH